MDFSGQTPYYYALDRKWISEDEAAFTRFIGMGLLGTVLNIFLNREKITTSLSVDTVDEKAIQLVLDEYKLNDLHFELFPINNYKPYDEIVDFHVNHYMNKKTEVAITCLLTVYESLQKMGIPCYRIVPSRLAIQTVFNLLVSRATSQIFEKSKIVIIGIEMFQNQISKTHNLNEVQRNNLLIELEMLKVAEKLNGILESKRNGRFHIFTTYGDFELLHGNQPFNELLKEVELQISIDLKVGIGTGYTVFDAMENVEFAFNNHNSTIANNIVVVVQDKKPFNLSSGMATYFTVEKIPDSWKKI